MRFVIVLMLAIGIPASLPAQFAGGSAGGQLAPGLSYDAIYGTDELNRHWLRAVSGETSLVWTRLWCVRRALKSGKRPVGTSRPCVRQPRTPTAES